MFRKLLKRAGAEAILFHADAIYAALLLAQICMLILKASMIPSLPIILVILPVLLMMVFGIFIISYATYTVLRHREEENNG